MMTYLAETIIVNVILYFNLRHPDTAYANRMKHMYDSDDIT